jgi:hypothetical protein
MWKLVLIEASKKGDLATLKKYEKFNNNDLYSYKTAIYYASENGNLEVMNWWVNRLGKSLKSHCDEKTMNYASANGHVKVLDILKSNGVSSFSIDAVILAGLNGHVNVLQWWEDSPFNIEYNERVAIAASLNGHVNVLQWLFQRYPHIFKNSVLDIINSLQNTDIIDWWNKTVSNSKKIDKFQITDEKISIEMLQWCVDNGVELQYDERSLDYPCKTGDVDTLQWWKDSGLEMKYDKKAIALACEYGRVNVLQWWKDSGLEMKYGKSAIAAASIINQIDVLDWWKDSGLEMKYDKRTFLLACLNNNIEVLKWWKENDLDLVPVYSQELDGNVFRSIYRWLHDNNILEY